jgi:hypothetical protein
LRVDPKNEKLNVESEFGARTNKAIIPAGRFDDPACEL